MSLTSFKLDRGYKAPHANFSVHANGNVGLFVQVSMEINCEHFIIDSVAKQNHICHDALNKN